MPCHYYAKFVKLVYTCVTPLSIHGQITWVQKVLKGTMIIRIFNLKNKLGAQIKNHQHSRGCGNRVLLHALHVVQESEPSKMKFY